MYTFNSKPTNTGSDRRPPKENVSSDVRPAGGRPQPGESWLWGVRLDSMSVGAAGGHGAPRRQFQNPNAHSHFYPRTLTGPGRDGHQWLVPVAAGGRGDGGGRRPQLGKSRQDLYTPKCDLYPRAVHLRPPHVFVSIYSIQPMGGMPSPLGPLYLPGDVVRGKLRGSFRQRLTARAVRLRVRIYGSKVMGPWVGNIVCHDMENTLAWLRPPYCYLPFCSDAPPLALPHSITHDS